jgi:peroxiredoxin Q/BCP
MRKNNFINMARLLIAVALMSFSQLSGASTQPLQVGDKAPSFDLPGTDGRSHVLPLPNNADTPWTVLAWFPKAYTSGCTIECRSLAQNGHLIKKFNVRYFMLSVDPIETNKAFAADESADFPLLSDATTEIAEKYGVLSPRGYAKRQTFYVDPQGTIQAIDRKVNPKTSAEDMAMYLLKLNAPLVASENGAG